MIIRVKGIKRYTHPVSGIEYVYHRKSGIRILAEPGTPAFFDELQRAETTVADKPGPRPGTLGATIKTYRASHHFTALKPRTRSDYDKVFNYLAGIDGMPVAAIDAPFVAKLRDKVFAQRKRRFANYCLAVLSVVFEFGLEQGYVRSNPVRDVKKIRRRADEPEANRPWTAAERDAVLAAAPDHLRRPIAIGRWTGFREGDVLRLTRAHYDGNAIRMVTGKRSVPVAIPVAAPLKGVLAHPVFLAARRANQGPSRLRSAPRAEGRRGQSWVSGRAFAPS